MARPLLLLLAGTVALSACGTPAANTPDTPFGTKVSASGLSGYYASRGGASSIVGRSGIGSFGGIGRHGLGHYGGFGYGGYGGYGLYGGLGYPFGYGGYGLYGGFGYPFGYGGYGLSSPILPFYGALSYPYWGSYGLIGGGYLGGLIGGGYLGGYPGLIGGGIPWRIGDGRFVPPGLSPQPPGRRPHRPVPQPPPETPAPEPMPEEPAPEPTPEAPAPEPTPEAPAPEPPPETPAPEPTPEAPAPDNGTQQPPEGVPPAPETI